MSHRQLDRASSIVRLGDDDTGCTILHVDMDAFFASVELRDRPDLRGKPVIIGRGQGRGVVLSATYEARQYGVHSAMPMAQAQHRCPTAYIIEPTHGKYTSASKQVMALLADITPACEVVSVDEAYLDVASVVRASGRPVVIARRIRERMQAELNLTCSVGIAASTFVAKAASTQVKPDGLLLVPRESQQQFLYSLPIGQLWGVGPGTKPKLASLGITTVADLATMSEKALAGAVGAHAAQRLLALANGHEMRPVNPGVSEKSISSERTFDIDLLTEADMRAALRSLSESVGRRVRSGKHLARTVGLKVRFDDFSTLTRSVTVSEPTDNSMLFYRAACRMLDGLALAQGTKVRLLGIRAAGLVDVQATGNQLTLDLSRDSAPGISSEVDVVVDEVAARFGVQAVRPARTLGDRNRH